MSIRLSVDVDLKNRAICGWIATSEVAVAELGLRGEKILSVQCVLPRKDIKALGFHVTGECGFAFYERRDLLVVGNIYEVILKVPAEKDRVFYRLYGDTKTLLEEFVRFELLPRDDLSFLQNSTKDVLAAVPDIFAYKTLMIRLRRGKRGKGSRGVFVGVGYDHKVTDFVCFRQLTEKYLTVWLGFLDARYLWSVVDTYADYGTDIERLSALAVSNYMYAERFFQTQKCVYVFSEKIDADKVIERQLPFWGGMKTNQLAADDSLDVFLTRNIEILSFSPAIKSIFYELLRRASNEPESGLGVNIKHSIFFRDIFKKYSAEYMK